MKRILNNFKLLLVVVTVLVIFNIFVTGSAVSKYLLATKFAIWNVQRNNKFTFGTSFAQLYGDEFNPFKEVFFLDDDGETTEKQAEQQAEQSQGQAQSNKADSAGEEELWNKAKEALKGLYSNDASKTYSKDKDLDNMAAAYVLLVKGWDRWSRLSNVFPKSHESIAGVMANIQNESSGSPSVMEDSYSSNQIAVTGTSKKTLETYDQFLKFCEHKMSSSNSSMPIGGIGVFQFTYYTLFKDLKSKVEKMMSDNGFSRSDKINPYKLSEVQINYFMPGADPLGGQWGYINNLSTTYPGEYDIGNKTFSRKDGNNLYMMSDWFCACMERPGNKRKSCDTRRVYAKQILDAIKDLPLNISSGISSQLSQSNATPTIGQGDSIWIMGDSRTHGLINYLRYQVKLKMIGSEITLPAWSLTNGSVPTCTKFELSENGKTIQLNVFGVSSMGFQSTLGGASNTKATQEYMKFLEQVGYIKSPTSVVFLWFGINGGTPDRYKDMVNDIYGGVRTYQFSVPAAKVYGNKLANYDSINNKLKKIFGSNFIDICSEDSAFGYNGSDLDEFMRLAKSKYDGPGLHFLSTSDSYGYLWSNIKKGIFDRIK
jgi:hypothetical protein